MELSQEEKLEVLREMIAEVAGHNTSWMGAQKGLVRVFRAEVKKHEKRIAKAAARHLVQSLLDELERI